MISRLTIEDIRNIFTWLKEHDIEYQGGKIHRDFSDCVKVAKILQATYPRLVDMNNYPKRNNTAMKMSNWHTLNFKVLDKIGLHLNRKRIAKLAKSKSGAIEMLLHQIRLKETEFKRIHYPVVNVQEQIWTENDEVVITKVMRIIDDEIVEESEKLILYSIYDEMNKRSQALSERIAEKKQEAAHLRKIWELKNDHINEITARLEKAVMRSWMEQQNEIDQTEPSLNLGDIFDTDNKSEADSTSLEHDKAQNVVEDVGDDGEENAESPGVEVAEEAGEQ